jgi:hypothetical protein
VFHDTEEDDASCRRAQQAQEHPLLPLSVPSQASPPRTNLQFTWSLPHNKHAHTHTHTHTLSLSLSLSRVCLWKASFHECRAWICKSRAYALEGAADRWRIMNSELLRRTEANDVNCPSLVRDARKTGHVCCSSESCLLACHHLHLLVRWNVQRQDRQLFFSLPLLREFLL